MFATIASALLAERGNNAEVRESGIDDEVVIRCSDVSQNGPVSISWQDAFVGRKSGFVTIGSTSVANVSLAKTADLLNEVSASTFLFYCNPQAVSVEVRTGVFERIAKVAEVQLQKRDGEADFGHLIRRARGDGVLELIRVVLLDLESAEFRSDWNSGANGMCRFRIRVSPVEDSALADLIRANAARPGPGCPPSVGPDQVAGLAVNAHLPPEFLHRLALLWGKRPEGLVAFDELIDSIVKAQQCSAVVVAEAGGEGMTLRGTAGTGQSLQAVWGQMAVRDPPAFRPVISGRPDPFPLSPFRNTKTLTMQVAAADVADTIAFMITQGEQSVDLKGGPPRVNDDTSAPVLELWCDVGRLANATDGSRIPDQLIELERVMHQWMAVWNVRDRSWDRLRQYDDPPFEPVSPALWTSEGDWRFHLALRTQGKDIVVDGSAGRELHQAFLVRTLLTEQQFREMPFLRTFLMGAGRP